MAEIMYQVDAKKWEIDNLIVNPFIGWFPSYSLTPEQQEQLQEELENLETYSEKLRHFFTWTGDLVIRTVAEEEESGHILINLTPANTEEIRAYNTLVRQLLLEANDKGAHYFVKFEALIQSLEERIQSNPRLKEKIIETEKRRVRSVFPVDEELQDRQALFFGDDPTQEFFSLEDSAFYRSQIFNYLEVGKTINYDQFINWWHHLQILNAEEKLRYYTYLLDPASVSVTKAGDNSTEVPAPNGASTTGNASPKEVAVIGEKVEQVYKILAPFFSAEEQEDFRRLLQGIPVDHKLTFLGQINRFAYAFRLLKEHDFIVGFEKKDVIHWILKHFQFKNSRTKAPRSSSYKALEKIISTGYDLKTPIFDIDNDELVEPEPPNKYKKKYRY